VVRELATEAKEKLDPEVEFAVAGVLAEDEGALPLLVRRLVWKEDDFDIGEYSSVLRLLDQAVQLQVRPRWTVPAVSMLCVVRCALGRAVDVLCW
jgi:hypothetical protein